jgi:ferritin-like metal-binding protein YciE
MATSLVIGVFDSRHAASIAIESLLEAGIPMENISVMASSDGRQGFGIQTASKVGTGAAIGGGLGGAAGALFAGLTAVGTIATSGVGLLAAGPIVAALAGAGAGAAAGGVVGGLVGLGIPEHEVRYYQDALEKGSVIVGVRTDSANKTLVKDILKERGSRHDEAASRAVSSSTQGGKRAASDETDGGGMETLLVEQLRDMYYAEKQLARALPEMRDSAHDSRLKQAFASHEQQTQEHVQRLKTIFEQMGLNEDGTRCPAIDGIVSEARELMKLNLSPAAHDAALVCAAQKAEHYEIGTYGCLRAYANLLGYDQASSLLDQTLSEEKAADELLSRLAETHLNPLAAATR